MSLSSQLARKKSLIIGFTQPQLHRHHNKHKTPFVTSGRAIRSAFSDAQSNCSEHTLLGPPPFLSEEVSSLLQKRNGFLQ